jgi:hypothetical protein
VATGARAERAAQHYSRTHNVTIVRVGTNKQYSEGWEAAFGKGKKQSAPAAKKSAAKKAKASAKKKPKAKKGKK